MIFGLNVVDKDKEMLMNLHLLKTSSILETASSRLKKGTARLLVFCCCDK